MQTEKKNDRRLLMAGVFLVAGALVTVGIASMLMSVFERRAEGENPYFRIAELSETTYDRLKNCIKFIYYIKCCCISSNCKS